MIFAVEYFGEQFQKPLTNAYIYVADSLFVVMYFLGDPFHRSIE